MSEKDPWQEQIDQAKADYEAKKEEQRTAQIAKLVLGIPPEFDPEDERKNHPSKDDKLK